MTAGSVDVDVGASRIDIPLVTEGDGDTHGRQQLDLVSSEQSTPEVGSLGVTENLVSYGNDDHHHDRWMDIQTHLVV